MMQEQPQPSDQKEKVKKPEAPNLLGEKHLRGFAVLADALFGLSNVVSDPSQRRQAIDNLNDFIHTTWVPAQLLAQGEAYIRRYITVDRSPGESEQQFAASVAAKQEQYLASLQDLLTQLNFIRRETKTAEQVEKTLPYGLKEVAANYFMIEQPLPPKNDTLRMLVHNSESLTNVSEVVDEIEKVWKVLRWADMAHKQVVTVYLHGAQEPERIRAMAFMRESPLFSVDMGDSNRKDIARHEAVHAVLGLEAGAPKNIDFAEGCALRLAQAIGSGTDRSNRPEMLVGHNEILQHKMAQTGLLVASHTQLVEHMRPQDRQQAVPEREYSYIFGYFLMDELLRSPENQAFAAKARAENSDPYGLIKAINRSLTDESIKQAFPQNPNPRNRDMLRFALTQNGVDAARIINLVSLRLQNVRSSEPKQWQ
jgi:hypothetical protein